MPGPKIKILPAITIPSGGWTLKVYITDTVQFDTGVTATMSAGTYYMSNDNQSDCFLWELMDKLYDALDALGAGGGKDDYNGSDYLGKPILWIDNATQKVKILLGGETADMRFSWSENDGDSIADVLGFNSATVNDYTGTTLTADWQHAYGWYDDEGAAADYIVEDIAEPNVLQSVAPSGHVKTTYIDTLYKNTLELQLVKRLRMWSGGIGYAEESIDPYERNVPLECWFKEAEQGIQFRVYEYNQWDTTLALRTGTATGGSTTTLIDSIIGGFDADPQEHKGQIIEIDGATEGILRYYISSHTTTTFTLPNALLNVDLNGEDYTIYDMRYRTYVLDLRAMRAFAPVEVSRTNRFNLIIPMRKYL